MYILLLFGNIFAFCEKGCEMCWGIGIKQRNAGPLVLQPGMYPIRWIFDICSAICLLSF